MPGCEYARCSPDESFEMLHIPSGETYEYCPGHSPEPDGETWRVA